MGYPANALAFEHRCIPICGVPLPAEYQVSTHRSRALHMGRPDVHLVNMDYPANALAFVRLIDSAFDALTC